MTEFGKILRKLRIDCNELLGDMADKLGISPAFLSSIENGRKAVPLGIPQKIARLYTLETQDEDRLQNAADATNRQIRLSLEHANLQKRSMALSFARCFEEMSEEDVQAIQAILSKNVGEE